MKRALTLCLLSLAAALPALTSVSAHAAADPAGRHGVAPIQIKAQLYRAWLNGTTAADEKNSYPFAPSDRAEVSASRCGYVLGHPGASEFPAITRSVCSQ
jgi:ABC-type sugar transport system substrate-binding protein